MISAEALFNGSRWRLQVYAGGTWKVSKRNHIGPEWEDIFSGDRGLAGVRESGADLRFARWVEKGLQSAKLGSLLDTLADVAESGRAA
jgi:hypothetical protein